jgi:hypothetical protein
MLLRPTFDGMTSRRGQDETLCLLALKKKTKIFLDLFGERLSSAAESTYTRGTQ